MGTSPSAFPLRGDHAQARRSPGHLRDVEPVADRHDPLDRVASLRDQHPGAAERVGALRRQRDVQDPAARCALPREHVEIGAVAELGTHGQVREAGKALPRRLSGLPQPELRLPAVPVLHERQDPLPVPPGVELHLGDAGELVAELLAVGRFGLTQLVEPDLLVEGQVRRGALAFPRVARVPEARTVAVPRQRAAGRAAVDAPDRLADRLHGRHVEDVGIAGLRSSPGERHRELPAVGRRHEPVDGGLAGGIEDGWIQEQPLLRRVFRRRHPDQDRLLPCRVALPGEEGAAPLDHVEPGRRARQRDGLHLLPDLLRARQPVEVGTGGGGLGLAPGLHLG